MSWTTPADVAAIFPPQMKLPPVEKIQAYIDNVERQIKRHYPKIDDRILIADITVEDITDAVSRILGEYIATEGSPFQQETQSYGSVASRTVMFDGSARKTLLLTPADLAQFGPNSGDQATSLDMAPNAFAKRPLFVDIPVAPQLQPWLVDVPWT